MKHYLLALAALLAPPYHAQEPSLRPERAWWQDRVWYEVFVRSFADSTTGPLAGDGVGDLRGLIERLDYLNDGDPATTDDLGITGIWLMPINQSPSYHGYDVMDFRSVDDEYGTLDDMKELVEECHKRGIAVIIDWVLNHSSSGHPWFIEATEPTSDKHDWYVWSEQRPDYDGPWGQNVWWGQAKATTGKWYYGAFWHGMPDLNWRNLQVEHAITDAALWWLDEVGIDGFRLDAVKVLIADGADKQENTPETLDALARFNKSLKERFPESFIVGEAWDDTPTVAAYLTPRDAGRAADGSYVGTGRASSLDSAFEFDLGFGLVEGLRDADAEKIAERLRRAWATHPEHTFSTFLTNHDQTRISDEFEGDQDKLRLAATLLMTMPGVPFMYYGEEIGFRGAKPDEDIRRPMPWDSTPLAGFSTAEPWRPHWPESRTVNIAAQTDDPGSLLSHYRRMIRLRQGDPRLSEGGVAVLRTGRSDVLAFVRTSNDGSGVLVIANLSDEPVSAYAIRGRGTRLGRTLEARMLLGEGSPDVPTRVVRGAMAGYRPLRELAPTSAYVINLSPTDQ